MTRAIFVDRDGVLNEAIVADGQARSPRSLSEFVILPDVAEATTKAHEAGWRVVVVSNQPEIQRGSLAPHVLVAMHEYLAEIVHVDLIKVCPHDLGARCACRKPLPGMLFEAAHECGIDLSRSWMVGDRWVDIAAGTAAGTATALVERDYSWRHSSDQVPPTDLAATITVANFSLAVDYILANASRES